MREESGFSLIEVIISIILLGIIAAGFAMAAFPNAKATRMYNEADLMAEREVEKCRSIGFSVTPMSAVTQQIKNGNNVTDTYVYSRQVNIYDIKTLSTGTNSSNLLDDTSNGILKAGSASTPATMVKQVVITVKDSNNITLAQRVIYISK